MDWLTNKKLAFHVHTKFSHDSFASPEGVIDFLFDSGYNAVVITDHNTIDGALIAKQYADLKYPSFQVIIGEEISTDIGDIIAFPLNKIIKEGTFLNVIENAKKSDALICLPHPYESHDLQKIHTSEFLQMIEFVEVYNSRISLKKNLFAVQYAEYYNKNKIVGTDAHIIKELNNNYNYFKSIKENEYIIVKYSKRRYIRISQFITYYKKMDFVKMLKYMFLIIINK